MRSPRADHRHRRTVQSIPKRSRSPRGSGELLAEEIISAASELLLEHGDDTAVSIRAVASRVGVTPPSIYLHFEDKDALLDAVCARYFEQLDGEFAAVADGVDDPLERALQMGIAYVRFATSTPVLYRIAFRQSAPGPSKVDEVLSASAFTRIATTVAELAAEGFYPESDVGEVVLELWAAAHGVASLMLAKPELPWGEDFRLAETLLRAVCLGRTTLGMLGLDTECDDLRTWLHAQHRSPDGSDGG
ncbi:TetR family transcriptional regulator [Gordonia sp. HNM0687]|uniref:TetR family transcriptional regulator n=1 Tax=Gordonia mangrovi TaxID=2665643 RepID=A0A6L7GTS5_9ACTN|nr:TetR/AcrR family transcriptional regulator [Gordonia mangrovi]MXP22963.1 TetR family transcriptional regulator [Gordonia mangrovi]UVF77261.1 TetR/AcrR family transcriptional regulator [Gordonia mangrovi]